jgi:hypothetical protein
MFKDQGDNSVIIGNRVQPEQPKNRGLIPDGRKIFSILYSHIASYPMGTGGFFLWDNAAEATGHLHLVSRLKIIVTIPRLPHKCSCRVA